MRVALHTLGCKANQADATYLTAVLRQKGYQVVGLNDVAEYYIFNTCTVTDEADREARQLTRRAKRKNPDAKVIVTGCYAQTQAEAVAALPSVDEVVGNQEKGNIPELLPLLAKEGIEGRPTKDPSLTLPFVRGGSIRRQTNVPSFGFSHYSKNTRAQVKIQDGCDKFCTFCIIPFARGKNRSVPPEQIISELHELRRHGYEEAVLTGIHIGTYGLDIHSSLENLLEQIEAAKPLPRIRLSSLDPEEISDRLIQMIANSEIICPHIHVAVQSGDDTILARMKRRYGVGQFRDIINQIVKVMPKIAIGTDLIVGFPGETEAQFEHSYQMIAELPISYAHVFPYSTRKGTPAASYPGQVSPDEKKKRTKRLRQLSQSKRMRYFEQFLGKPLEIVVESRREPKEGLLRGVTPNYIPVHFKGTDHLLRTRQIIRLDQIHNSRVYGHVA